MWDLEVLYKEGNDTFKFLQKKEKKKKKKSPQLPCLGFCFVWGFWGVLCFFSSGVRG